LVILTNIYIHIYFGTKFFSHLRNNKVKFRQYTKSIRYMTGIFFYLKWTGDFFSHFTDIRRCNSNTDHSACVLLSYIGPDVVQMWLFMSEKKPISKTRWGILSEQ